MAPLVDVLEGLWLRPVLSRVRIPVSAWTQSHWTKRGLGVCTKSSFLCRWPPGKLGPPALGSLDGPCSSASCLPSPPPTSAVSPQNCAVSLLHLWPPRGCGASIVVPTCLAAPPPTAPPRPQVSGSRLFSRGPFPLFSDHVLLCCNLPACLTCCDLRAEASLACVSVGWTWLWWEVGGSRDLL